MIAALVVVDLHLPGSTSLKSKRGPVRSITAALRNDLGVSVAEVDHQDLWQRTTLGVAIAATSETGARKVAQNVEKICQRDPRAEVIGIHIEIVQTEER
jgi:uncharacterized protein